MADDDEILTDPDEIERAFYEGFFRVGPDETPDPALTDR